MRLIIRKMTRAIVKVTRKVACRTYGDVASLSDGPCRRCVGMRVIANDLPKATESDELWVKGFEAGFDQGYQVGKAEIGV